MLVERAGFAACTTFTAGRAPTRASGRVDLAVGTGPGQGATAAGRRLCRSPALAVVTAPAFRTDRAYGSARCLAAAPQQYQPNQEYARLHPAQ